MKTANMVNFSVVARRAVDLEIAPPIAETETLMAAQIIASGLYKDSQYLAKCGYAKHAIQIQVLNSNKDVLGCYGSI